MKITHRKGNIIQYNEYYPFGMQTASSWTRENAVANNFLGNSGTELNQVTALYDLEYRQFDAVLGRMNGVDPMADKYSSLTPYNYAFNMPNMRNDLNGADPTSTAMWYEEQAQRKVAMELAKYGHVNSAGGGNEMSTVRGTFDQTFWGNFMNIGGSSNLQSFLDDALDSRYGGTWSNGTSTTFKSDLDGFDAAEDYFNTFGWQSTNFNDRDGYAEGFSLRSGYLPLREVTIQETRTNSNWLQTRIDEALGGRSSGGTHTSSSTRGSGPQLLQAGFGPGVTPDEARNLLDGILITTEGLLLVKGGKSRHTVFKKCGVQRSKTSL
jgi:RHS repeat-associated protein